MAQMVLQDRTISVEERDKDCLRVALGSDVGDPINPAGCPAWLYITAEAPWLVAGRRYRIEGTGIAWLDGTHHSVPAIGAEMPGLAFLVRGFDVAGYLDETLEGRGRLTMLYFMDDDLARVFGEGGSVMLN